MSNILITAAIAKKTRAKGLRNDAFESDPPDQKLVNLAVRTLDLAINQLENALKSGEDQRTSWSQLADCYGIKGGIYSRLRAFPEALKMYQEGRKWEKKPTEKTSTYNLSNVIVHSIIVGQTSLDSKDIQKNLVDTLIPPLQEVTKGTRKDDWWAWADLGQFQLLQGAAANALDSYEKGFATGPTVEDLESSLRVIRELKNSVNDNRYLRGLEQAVKKLESKKKALGHTPLLS